MFSINNVIPKRFFSTIISIAFLFTHFSQLNAQSPSWEDNPGAYEFVSFLVGGIVINDGVQLGGAGDMFAAFDASDNVRGIGVELNPPFGPYEGTPVWEMTMRSNNAGETLYFKYYDASEDAILDIEETYNFIINEKCLKKLIVMFHEFLV